MPLVNGAVFAGYVIQRQLGSGGMGEVYLAQHPRLPRLDALKILPASLTHDDDFRQRFNREADLAATLWHTNIVGLHDRGEFEGQLWIAMDFVDGTDAARLLREQYADGMPLPDVLDIVAAVADALDYAHQRKLLHRDVKPANILLTRSDAEQRRILLADFGVARHAEDISGLTATNMAIGSVWYAAPEQLMGESMDGRADQYALAATAFHLLTGVPVFEHSNPVAVISKHLNAPPPRLADLRPDLAPLDHVLGKGLSKNPEDRYATCLEFASALKAAATSAPAPTESTIAAPVGGSEPAHETAQASTQLPWAGPPLPAPPPLPTPPPLPATAYARKTRRRWPAVLVPLVLVALLAGAIGFAATQILRPGPVPSTAPPRWQPYVDAAGQFTVVMTSLDWQAAERDVQRVLDASTGEFRTEFEARSADFIQVVKDSKVKTEGTVTGAALDSIEGNSVYALVAATSKVTNSAGASEEPRSWRLRVRVEKVGDSYKASKVEFVP